MSWIFDYDFSPMVNQQERWIKELLQQELERHTEVCRCEECVLDMMALALNQSLPHYRVTLMGAIYSGDLDEKTLGNLKKAVRDALRKVAANPSCGRTPTTIVD